MNRFDTLFEQILYTEAEGDMSSLPGGAPPPAGPRAPQGAPGMPTDANSNQSLPPIPPEENIDDSEDDQSALVSEKKLQLIKLIAVAISTRAPAVGAQDPHNKQVIIQKILSVLNTPATDGTVEKMEKQIISAIAKLQDINPFEIAKTIGYTTPGPEEESNRYIDITEYKNLVEIARKALIADPDQVAGVDKLNIEPGKITGSNAEEVLTKIQNIYGRVL